MSVEQWLQHESLYQKLLLFVLDQFKLSVKKTTDQFIKVKIVIYNYRVHRPICVFEQVGQVLTLTTIYLKSILFRNLVRLINKYIYWVGTLLQDTSEQKFCSFKYGFEQELYIHKLYSIPA